jgi:pyruvate dehydrogenase E2 component (dihydrolipoamide acetyltransferase)
MKTVIMPKLGFTQTESTIVAWLKHEGDAVEQGEPIAEVTTDKINMEVEAPESGTLAGLRFYEGDTVPVTETIAFILKPGERVPENAGGGEKKNGRKGDMEISATPIAKRMAAELGVDLSSIKGTGAGGKITREDVEVKSKEEGARSGEQRAEGTVRATPAARRLARENEVDLALVAGSGPNGRVQGQDVLTESEKQKVENKKVISNELLIPNPQSLIPYSGMRKTIGTRLQASYQQIPHITFDADVDVSAAEALRARANASLKSGQAKISLTAVIAKACAWALQRHPIVNSRLDETAGHIVVLDEVNIGIAVALDGSPTGGLIVPVVRLVHLKGMQQIANEMADLAARAKANKLKQDEITSGTFSISNLGMYGVDRFTAIINPPETAILAVGRSQMRFVPDANGQPVAKPMMTIRLSADHRVIDGAVAAQFLGDVRAAIEEPGLMTL